MNNAISEHSQVVELIMELEKDNRVSRRWQLLWGALFIASLSLVGGLLVITL